MARSLIVTVGIRSHLNISLALTRRLTELGYETTISSPTRDLHQAVHDAGVAFRPLEPAKGELTYPPPGFPLRRIPISRARARARCDAVMTGLGLTSVLDEINPDLIVVDSELHEHIMLAKLLGYATIVMEPHVSALRRKNVPVQSDFFVPSSSLVSRLQCAFGWSRTLLRRRIVRAARRVIDYPYDKHTVMQRLARRHGRRLRSFADLTHWQLYTFPGLPCIRATVPEMDFPPRIDEPRHFFAGPLILDPEDRSHDARSDSSVDKFLASRPAGTPTIIMSLGTIKTSEHRISRAIDAVRDQPVSLLLAAGPAAGAITDAARPSNVFSAKWLPLVQLMPRADVMICHGGISTIHECVQAGLPMLVYPFKNVIDQDGNAARVLGNGLGLVGEERDTPEQMWQRIRQLLDAPGYRQRCCDMARVFAHYGANDDLAAFLKQCIAESGIAGRNNP